MQMLDILIVEDNAAFRESLCQLLARRFPALRVREAADCDAAMRHALAVRADLVFMDLRLPQCNGLDLTRTIKALSADTCVCVLTSHAALEYREAALRHGADHFMVKGETTEADAVALVESYLLSRDGRSE
jgi:DNA-binding NarL/FixJ family response regulator